MKSDIKKIDNVDNDVVSTDRKKINGAEKPEIIDAIYAFGVEKDCAKLGRFGQGHINETYALYYMEDEAVSDTPRYILQKINTNVFKEPSQVMENIFGVTEYLRDIIAKNGGDSEREALVFLKTLSGDTYFEDHLGQAWRCLLYVKDSVCYQQVENPEQFYQSALSFGNFLKQLGDYPAETLHETIPQFHDTPKRFRDFTAAVEADSENRACTCREEIDFVLSREKDCHVLMDQLNKGLLPLRVTHNDTKLNNILFDEKTDKALCIIDLDTIMPGLAANDFGDSIRFGASTAEEDEKDLDKVHFDINLYETYVKGYLEMAKDVLTPAEVKSLPWGARLMTLECGSRFLADYLEGDGYFNTAYPEHNLVRARTQFRLVKEMEEQFDEMNNILDKYM